MNKHFSKRAFDVQTIGTYHGMQMLHSHIFFNTHFDVSGSNNYVRTYVIHLQTKHCRDISLTISHRMRPSGIDKIA